MNSKEEDIYRSQLHDFIKQTNKSKITSLCVGIFLTIGCVISILYLRNSEQTFTSLILHPHHYHLRPIFNISITVPILIEVSSIICFIAFKNNLKQETLYKQELIVLRDLFISIRLCDEMPADEVKVKAVEAALSSVGGGIEASFISYKTKVKELIIQTMLDRCGK